MNCSTTLTIRPIIPCLSRGWALLFALSLLLQTIYVSDSTQIWCLGPVTPTGRYRLRRTVKYRHQSSTRWVHLLPGLLTRTLVRCGLLAGLLHLNGWIDNAPSTWCLLLVPVAHSVILVGMLTCTHGRDHRRAHCWAKSLQHLYQLILLILLTGLLYRLLVTVGITGLGCYAVCLPFTWRTPPDEEAEVTITTLAADEAHPLGHYQVTLRGTFTLTWTPRDSFERWILILFLRKLHQAGVCRPFLTQYQIATAFDCFQRQISRWEMLVREHGWHILSDRYRHQRYSALPDPEMSRQILAIWVPAFWLSAWDVRERLIARGVIPDRSALTIDWLHKLAHHTGFAQIRQILLDRFQLQDGHLFAKEHWWLNELLALNNRLLDKLERGEKMMPQELVDVESLRLNTMPKNVDAASPSLATALHSVLFESAIDASNEPVRCAYCGSDHTAPKSKKPRLKTVIDPLTGQKRQINVFRYYCHNPDCAYKSFTHFPPGVLPHSPHPLQTRLIAVEVYEVLLSTYRRSARMFSISSATLYRWLISLCPVATALAAYLGVVRTSGIVGIDDKWLKVCSPSKVPPHGKRRRAVWRYAYFAIDIYSYDILALEIYPQHNDHAVHLLLLELKAKGIYPRVVVSDLDPAYGRMLPKVFPKAIHHECIFHAIQNSFKQLTTVYGRYYAETNPQAAALHDAVTHLFHANTQKTIRKRFHTLMALRAEYVAQTPAVACVFDSLQRHFPKLVNAIENPLIPRTNNATELVIRRFDQHYQSMCGLDSLESARLYLPVFEFVYRLTPFADDNQTKRIRGKSPLQLAGYDLDATPIAQFFAQFKLPTLAISDEEVSP